MSERTAQRVSIRKSVVTALRYALALFVFWIVITSSFALTNLAIGAAFSLVLGYWSARFLWIDDYDPLSTTQIKRAIAYIPRLIYSVIVSAIGVTRVVLSPHMVIDPHIATFETSLNRDVARVAFGNSITLTPGTLTVYQEGNTFFIHCLADEFASEIASGQLEQTVSRVFEG